MFQAGGGCFDTAAEAVAAQAAAMQPGIQATSAGLYFVSVSGVDGASGLITLASTDLSTGTTSTHEVSSIPQPCTLLTAADGAALGWGVCAAWLAIFGLIMLKKAAS